MVETEEYYARVISEQLKEIEEAQAIIDQAEQRIEVAVAKLKKIYYL